MPHHQGDYPIGEAAYGTFGYFNNSEAIVLGDNEDGCTATTPEYVLARRATVICVSHARACYHATPISPKFDNKFMLVFRGGCDFVDKSLNAQAAGANGLLIVDYDSTRDAVV